jgi:hypothetical protein
MLGFPSLWSARLPVVIGALGTTAKYLGQVPINTEYPEQVELANQVHNRL